VTEPASPPRGTLYVVATPIGNLEDLSARAVRVLGSVDLIACEDTRTTRPLLTRQGLSTRLVSHHKFNEPRSAAEILTILDRGGSIALVSDGGTPGISDPGALLVRRAREAGHRVVPIPGPSAVVALMSASGFPAGPFTFIGFLPHRRAERLRLLQSLRRESRPLIFFESPQRLLASLEDALEILGDRQACLGREMTKLHEELVGGTIGSIRAGFGERTPKGEVTFVVAGASGDETQEEPGDAPRPAPADEVRRLIAAGWDRKEAMRRVARERGCSRRSIYLELLRDKDPAK